eukprot:COSAG05_NODE_18605_length_306_cov_0.391304_1_plen_28_part_10
MTGSSENMKDSSENMKGSSAAQTRQSDQ